MGVKVIKDKKESSESSSNLIEPPETKQNKLFGEK